MPQKKKDKSAWNRTPQNSSAVQFLTYIASAGSEVYLREIRSICPYDILPFLDR